MILSKEFILKKFATMLLHTIFWVVVLFCYTYFFGYHSENIQYIFSFSLFLMPVTMGTTYTAIDILIPKYLLTEKYLLFILYSIYTCIISAFFIVISCFYGLLFLTEIEPQEMAPMTRSPLFLFIAVYFVVFIASALSLTQHNYRSNTDNQKLKNSILEAQLKLKEQELNYLKMQIHPHFLFNTLNTLYGFALKKSEETPEMILQLSNLLDYLLYQSDKPFVSLQEEIDHIQDYVALEKMRFSDVLDIKMHITPIEHSVQIPPMLLIPFVENSFKHGHIIHGKLLINISLQYTDHELHFSIKNSSRSSRKTNEKGIGLTNIKKRLSLLYKENYHLSIINTTTAYQVQLVIKNNHTTLHES